MTSPTPDIAHYRRDAELTRHELTRTVDTIKDRIADAVSPAQVSRDLQSLIIRKARENPLQAAGIASALAFPLSRLVATIPAPVLLVGAGIALSRVQIPEAVTDQIDHAKGSAQGAIDSASGAFGALRDQATSAADDAIAAVSHQAERLSDGATDIIDTAASAVSTAARDVRQASEDYPLGLGLVGLAVGAILGAAIPASRSEETAFGELSDKLKDEAGTLASEGLKAAREAADAVYNEVAAEAEAQGITGEAAADAVDKLKGKTTEVVKDTQARATSKKT